MDKFANQFELPLKAVEEGTSERELEERLIASMEGEIITKWRQCLIQWSEREGRPQAAYNFFLFRGIPLEANSPCSYRLSLFASANPSGKELKVWYFGIQDGPWECGGSHKMY